MNIASNSQANLHALAYIVGFIPYDINETIASYEISFLYYSIRADDSFILQSATIDSVHPRFASKHPFVICLYNEYIE